MALPFLFNSRCIRSSRPDPDYAILLPQIVSFRIGSWVSNTVRNRYFGFLSKGVPQKIDAIFLNISAPRYRSLPETRPAKRPLMEMGR